MQDGSQQGIAADRALKTILGGEPAPGKEEERPPQYWLKRLTEKDDKIDGYEAHAEVMAKYIIKAYIDHPALQSLHCEPIYKKPYPDNPRDMIISEHGLDEALEKLYPDETHPFHLAYSAASVFTWGWAFNIARYALGLPPEPNPAILEI